MARFYGVVGYGSSVETTPGVWKDQITEKIYQGDVIRNSQRLANSGEVNENIILVNTISIVADQTAIERLNDIKYVNWDGVLWTVTSVQVQRPRLILFLGSVYNGPTP